MKPTRVTNSIRALRFAHGEMTQIARVFGVPLDDVFHYPGNEEEES